MSVTAVVPPPSSGGTPTASGDYGQSVVGDQVSSPWVPGENVPINQGWGPTDYAGEPGETRSSSQSDPGTYPHWHAGVDLGYDTATIVQFPDDQTWQAAVTQWLAQLPGGLGTGALAAAAPAGTFHQGVWNGSGYTPDPEGYGAHATTITIGNVDIILGHGSMYHQADKSTVRPGDALISVDTQGNATGPHLHFEVRPAQGAYGTDVDPWTMLTSGAASATQNPVANVGSDVEAAAGQIAAGIQQAETEFVDLAVGMAMAGGGVPLLAGAMYVAFKGFSAPSLPKGTPPRRPTPTPSHPQARVARATRASPAAPRIPRGPAEAVPVNSSRDAARAGLGPRAGLRNERTLSQRSRSVSTREISMRQRIRAQAAAGPEPPF
jgi:murein DD-endopeptidase MepM/ murein hydrolase activator NlpD